jgi:hypothetical protein
MPKAVRLWKYIEDADAQWRISKIQEGHKRTVCNE